MTTILCVRRNGKTALGGDGQVTMNNLVMKASARKIRRLGEGTVVAGFAGSTADAFTLFERFEAKLGECARDVRRASVELGKDWRSDRYLHRLEALLVVADAAHVLVVSGSGDVVEPDDGIAAVGSGGPFALASARALLGATDLDAKQIVERSMRIAADLCIFTNSALTIEEL